MARQKFSAHDPDSDDALLRPAFGRQDRINRLIWNIIYLLFFRLSPAPFHRYRCWILKQFGAKLGANNFIYPSVKIWAPWNLQTEDVVTLGPYCEVYNPAVITLGHHTIISQCAYLCGATHDYNAKNFDYQAKTIKTEPYAWVCARAIVLPGVSIGAGAVLGAGSVTSKDLDAWKIYAGNPAVFVKSRSKEVLT